MIKRWRKFCKNFNARAIRERLMLGGMVFVCIIGLWNVTINLAISSEMRTVRKQIELPKKQIKMMSEQIDKISKAIANSEAPMLRQQRGSLKNEIAMLSNHFRLVFTKVSSQKKISATIKKILQFARNNQLKVERFDSIEPVALSEAYESLADGEFSNRGLYQNGVVIEFRGQYLNTLSYLRQLEALDVELFWDSFDYEVGRYPYAHVRLRVYMLSHQEGLLGG